jgi:hypothetical protein
MIAVEIHPLGDTAEAETPEAAVYAAVTLIDDAKALTGIGQYASVKFTATFRGPDGAVVAAHVPQTALWATLGRAA